MCRVKVFVMQKKSFELTAKRLGNTVRFLKETASTNRDVDTAAQAGAAEGLLIMAETQTEGRGRMTRTWFSPGGANLYFSLLLRPDVELSSVPSLPLVVGLAVAEAIVACAPALLPKIKWPNDILVSGKKVCGILCELQTQHSKVDYVVIGIGVNVNLPAAEIPEELKERATSILIENGAPLNREHLLAEILNRLEPLYDNWRVFGFKPLLQSINALDALRGFSVSMELAGAPLEGVASGIQADGALLLQTSKGPRPIYSGEAHILAHDT
jgi:BirA family transcriptional regulator, biotin operon repressor / biotin---[acetyl-CoA-carboxylase] ligase